MSLLTKTLDAIEQYRRYNATRRELEQLTDRELRDLGISRFSIPQIAREAVYA